MGICKCRHRTNLFCFVHKAAVCETCICDPDHQQCFVKTYRDWLEDSEYEAPCCGVCKGDLGAEGRQVLRTACCLTLFHSECLDVYASSVPQPAHSRSPIVCPSCKRSLIPSIREDTTLSRRLFAYLEKARWARLARIGSGDAASGAGRDAKPTSQGHVFNRPHSNMSFNAANAFQSSPNSSAIGNTLFTSTPTGAMVGWGEGPFARPTARSSPPGRSTTIDVNATTRGSNAGGGAGPRSSTPTDFRDFEDDDKYSKKRKVGLMGSGQQRSLLLFAICTSVAVVVILVMSITS